MNVQEACNKISTKKREKLNKNKQFNEKKAENADL
jgi:hypothetical protein